MNNKFLWICFVAISIFFTACSDDPSIEIPSEFNEVNLEVGTETKKITFHANQSWTASVLETRATDISWVTISPESGSAGDAEITISVEKTNYSHEERIAYIHISIDGLSKSIPVKQDAYFTLIPDDEPIPAISEGFYVVNEDWFGHDNGTVNYFKKNGSNYDINYRVYREANSNESDWLGVTTQFATIWGDYAYFCSKQGNTLVVADAKTLKKKAIFTNIGGHGRSFLGIDDKKGYVGHANGVASFNIANMTLGEQISGVSGQMGNMVLSNGKIFALSQQNGVYVIDSQTDKILETIAGSYSTLTCSKDGYIWVGAADNIVKIDPKTLETEEIPFPEGTKFSGTWGAWNAGSLCASTQNNVIYWLTGSKTVVKYDIDTKTAISNLYTFGKDEGNFQLASYGAGLRVDPVTDELIVTVKRNGWGASGAYNWIYKLDANGNEITNFKVKGDNGSAASWGGNAEDWDGKYFWFPAMPFFEDANKPQILLNQVILKAGKEENIDLTEKIIDYDNTFISMQISLDATGNELAEVSLDGSNLTVKAGNKPGKSTCVLTVLSNGVRVEKTIKVDIEE